MKTVASCNLLRLVGNSLYRPVESGGCHLGCLAEEVIDPISEGELAMSNLSRGIGAGLAATVVLSMIMVAKGMMGLMPELNVIAKL